MARLDICTLDSTYLNPLFWLYLILNTYSFHADETVKRSTEI